MDVRLATWMANYVKAWNSNDPDDIAALFTEDAEYYTEPYAAPWQGRETIVREWLENRDEPGETDFSWQPIVVTTELSIIQGRTRYRTPLRTYSNLWIIRLDKRGQCTEFTEWWMEHPD